MLTSRNDWTHLFGPIYKDGERGTVLFVFEADLLDRGNRASIVAELSEVIGPHGRVRGRLQLDRVRECEAGTRAPRNEPRAGCPRNRGGGNIARGKNRPASG